MSFRKKVKLREAGSYYWSDLEITLVLQKQQIFKRCLKQNNFLHLNDGEFICSASSVGTQLSKTNKTLTKIIYSSQADQIK